MAQEVEGLLTKKEDWPYLAELPPELGGFTLSVDLLEEKDRVLFFSYAAPQLRRQVEAYYNLPTKDYMVKRYFGLNEYCDIQFITPDRKVFEGRLKERLVVCLEEMAMFSSERIGMVVRKTGIFDWEYGRKLPERIGGFDLYIRPFEPERLINGSVVVLDYSDFARNCQLAVYYNELRNEFYAEKKADGVVETTSLFDARNLKELEKLLASHLTTTLESFSK